jgi:hypothetical protein
MQGMVEYWNDGMMEWWSDRVVERIVKLDCGWGAAKSVSIAENMR